MDMRVTVVVMLYLYIKILNYMHTKKKQIIMVAKDFIRHSKPRKLQMILQQI